MLAALMPRKKSRRETAPPLATETST